MKLSDFNYNLPENLIAQYPTDKRDESKLMVVNKKERRIYHKKFYELVEYINNNDTLVLNNTKVVPARIFGKKSLSGGKVELLLLDNIGNNYYTALIRSSRIKQGDKIIIEDNICCQVEGKTEKGLNKLKFDNGVNVKLLLEKKGIIPLPPYIKRIAQERDTERYQTVYAKHKGAVAAPTAGLHFTKELLEKIENKGANIVYLTLHVGYGTFKPVVEENIVKHNMHSEYYSLPEETAVQINMTRKAGNKILCVGTTTARTLETTVSNNNIVKPQKGWTDIFIYPGYKFKIVDMLLTNFHLPKTTLLMLVSAFCDKELLFKAYDQAIKEKYRFYSYGDAMLIV